MFSTLTAQQGCGCAYCQHGHDHAGLLSDDSASILRDLAVLPGGGGTVTPASIGVNNAAELIHGFEWGLGGGTAASLTYSFPTSVPGYYVPNAQERNNFSPFTSEMQDSVRTALNHIEDFANLTFTEVTGVGDLIFGQAWLTTATSDPLAWGYYPDQGGHSGDVWFNNKYNFSPAMDEGNIGHYVSLHEIGHALGLIHSFSAGLTGPENTEQFTVMAYDTDPWGSVYAQSYMLYDMSALQAIYGANTSFNNGDTIYTLDPAAALTVWDGGGEDVFDSSAVSSDVIIHLEEGGYSSVGLTENIAIAYGAVIENATSGAGDDMLYGNASDNILRGNAGDDALFGGGGFDMAVYGGDFADYILSALSGVFTIDDTTGADGTDTATDVERFVFADGFYEGGTFHSGTGSSFITIDPALITGYSGAQDAGGTVVSSDTMLQMDGNTWKKLAYDYTVTSDTVLEFEFQATQMGEIHAIGLETDNDFLTGADPFAFYGSQTPHSLFNNDFDYTAGGAWQSFTIDVGDYMQGDIDYLTFINDDDANSGSEGAFRNIRLYEDVTELPTVPPGTPELIFSASDFESYTKQDGTGSGVSVTGTNEVALSGNAWKALDFDYTITENSYVSLDYKTIADGEVQGLIFLRDGLDPANISVNNLHDEHEFVRFDGTDAYNGTDNLYTESNGTWQNIIVKLSDYNSAGAAIDHIVFVNDDDADGSGQSAFRDIQIFESNALYATDQDDVFLFENIAQMSVVNDFNVEGDDVLDISGLLEGYDPLADMINDFVQVTDNGADTIISVDRDGGADHFTIIAILEGITGFDDAADFATADYLVTV